MTEEENKADRQPNFPPMIATHAMLQYLREIFMALDNISFQIRTTMNNIIVTKDNVKVEDFVVKNPNKEGEEDPVIEGVKTDDEE